MNNTNNGTARMTYNNAKQVLFDSWIASFKGDVQACWDWVNSRKLSQGEIRIEVELNANATLYTFAVDNTQRNTNGVVFQTEQRLQQQDSLISSEYALFVCKPADRDDVNFQLRSYGNTQDFTAGAAAAINGTLYCNGSLETKVNNDVIIPYRGLFNNWYKPQTQQTAALGAGSPQDQLRGAEDGSITNEPNILLIGSKNYKPSIVLKESLPVVDEFTRAVLIYRGVLAQNSTSIN